MPTEAKVAAVAALKEDLAASNATIVADYRGLTVSEIGAVRRALRGEGITYKVVKNRLAKIAAHEVGNDALTDMLEGPTALAMGGGDEVTLARTFLDAIRPYRTVAIRGAVLNGKRVDADSVTRLARLPSREVLLAQLAGGMASPMTTMASLLSAPLRNLGHALSQLMERKGPQPEAAPREARAAVAADATGSPPSEADVNEASTPASNEEEAPAPEAAEASSATPVEADAPAAEEAETAAEAATDESEATEPDPTDTTEPES